MSFWASYEELERKFSIITDVIPIVREHLYSPWSPQIRDFMALTYNAFDDIFKKMMTYPEYQYVKKVKDMKYENIHYYRRVLEDGHNLSSKTVIIKSEAISETFPFYEFSQSNVPEWWDAINKVRHNWNIYKHLANLHNSLNALAGLFLLNVMNKPSRVELVKLKVIRCAEKYDISFHKGAWNEILLDLKNGYSGWNFIAESKFFELHFPDSRELKEYFGI